MIIFAQRDAEGGLITSYDEQGREIYVITPPQPCPRCKAAHCFFRRNRGSLDRLCVVCADEAVDGGQ